MRRRWARRQLRCARAPTTPLSRQPPSRPLPPPPFPHPSSALLRPPLLSTSCLPGGPKTPAGGGGAAAATPAPPGAPFGPASPLAAATLTARCAALASECIARPCPSLRPSSQAPHVGLSSVSGLAVVQRLVPCHRHPPRPTSPTSPPSPQTPQAILTPPSLVRTTPFTSTTRRPHVVPPSPPPSPPPSFLLLRLADP